MAINNSQRAGFATELTGTTVTGSTILIGTLTQNPVIIIFDNQGAGSVAISVNDPTGATVWRTFPAGEALVLDLRAASGIAPNYTFDQGTTFFGTGVTGTLFSISYIYAQNM